MTATRHICYLWRCAGFGADPVQLNRSLRLGYPATVDFLLQAEPGEPGPAPPPTTVVPPGVVPTLAQLAGLVTWWVNRMAEAAHPLREKMTLFWHGFFTTSADPVFSGGLLLRQNQLLREHALGGFEDLLTAVAKDPAMLVYLDGFRNAAGGSQGAEQPNENFAREVMEMYSLGPHHYGEEDVRAAARAFTGWGLSWWGPDFAFDAQSHDDGPKRFLGAIGAWQGDDVLRRLARHPATATHVCRRLFEFLTGRSPGEEALDRWAQAFLRHHGQMLPVLRAMLRDGEFLAKAVEPAYLSPVEYLVSLLRVLQAPLAQLQDWKLLGRLQRMGQLPFLPPSVRGWPHGQAWINTATLWERIELVGELLQQHRSRLTAWLEERQSGLEHLLALCHRSDASSSLRRQLSQAGDAWRVFCLILQGPEFHLR